MFRAVPFFADTVGDDFAETLGFVRFAATSESFRFFVALRPPAVVIELVAFLLRVTFFLAEDVFFFGEAVFFALTLAFPVFFGAAFFVVFRVVATDRTSILPTMCRAVPM